MSRVEGTFEFEVQPLREYFSARHLYTTAPYSPPGRPRKGTRPDRFESIAGSFYWTNVARFFCGFYDAGELSSLVDGIVELANKEGYSLINQPRRLAMMLLSDRVFSQEPRTMKRLIDFVCNEPEFQRLISVTALHDRRDMGLPDSTGRKLLFQACSLKLEEEDNPIRRRTLRQIMAENADKEMLKLVWQNRFDNGEIQCSPIQEAMDFGLLHFFTDSEIESIAGNDTGLRVNWLVRTNRYEAIVNNSNLMEFAINAFFVGDLDFSFRWYYSAESLVTLEALTELFRPHFLASILGSDETDVAAYSMVGRGYPEKEFDLFERVRSRYERESTDPLEKYVLFIFDLLNNNMDCWQNNLTLWSELVDHGLTFASQNQITLQAALISTASRAGSKAGEWGRDGFLPTKGIVKRLFFARHRYRDNHWWQTEISDITSATAGQFLTILLSWGAPRVIRSMKADIENLISNFSVPEWNRFWSSINFVLRFSRTAGEPITKRWFRSMGDLSPRLALVLIRRMKDEKGAREMSKCCFSKYEGGDGRILQMAIQIALFSADDHTIDWKYVEHLSKQAHQNGVELHFPIIGSLPQEVPVDILISILSNSREHSPYLVALCEQAYSTKVAQTAPKISYVAEKDGWFLPND